jgi:hypothetical protein
MNTPDDLQALWQQSPVASGRKGDEMLAIVEKKSRTFDRKIRVRNWVECIAGVVVAAAFGWIAFAIAPNAVVRSGAIIVVLSAVWVIFYIVRYGGNPAPVPDQTLASYRQALTENYDHQIRLLRNVKYWYVLPPYIGVLTLSAGILMEVSKHRPLNPKDFVSPAICTTVSVLIWWLNEGYGVRKLRKERESLLEATKGLE